MKNNQNSVSSISVVGLGKLGLCLALAFASKGLKVIGVDINNKLLASLKKGKILHYEPQVEEYLNKYKNNIYFTSDYNYAIEHSEATIVLVSTPSDTYGKFSNRYVENSLKSLMQSYKKVGKKYHLIIISSTLMPRSIKERLIPLMEDISGEKNKIGFGVTFVPDFVALGNVIDDFLNPDFVMVGEDDKRAGDLTANLYKKMVSKNSPIVRIPITDAEIAKVALNCYITTKISFANSISNLCGKIPESNVDNVTYAIGHDKRINHLYLKGGPSFGGTCFPRDTKAYLALAKKYNVQSLLIKAVDKVNNYQDEYIIDHILSEYKSNNREVVIVGTSFKKDTSVIEKSVAFNIIPTLISKKVPVCVYDSISILETKKVFGNDIKYLSNLSTLLNKPRIIVVCNSYKELKDLDYVHSKYETSIIDCWRALLPKVRNINNIKYIGMGIYSEEI